MVRRLTIQINYQHAWHDAAILEFPDLLNSSRCRLDYEMSHVLKPEFYQQFADSAISVRLPIESMPFRQHNWFKFIDDIMPAGSSRNYWLRKLGLTDENLAARNFELLSRGTIAPIGNVRIKESIPERPENPIVIHFTVEDVCRLEVDFIEYAQANGAAAGGASGAGGAAPKLLVRRSQDGGIWIDTFQDTPDNTDIRYLVKFPRGVNDIDKDILRAEYHFYHELHALGFNTIPLEHMMLEESARGPSLWLPRFDSIIIDNKEQLLGLESVYSMLGAAPGTPMLHGDVIRGIIQVLSNPDIYGNTTTLLDEDDGIAKFVIEWVRRDLLNIAFGNSDNHGRNTSFIKMNNNVSLSPIYDFAPMKADPETITRTFTWGQNLELGGRFHFARIAESLRDLVEPQLLLTELNMTAESLIGLKERLATRGVTDSILNFPSMSYQDLRVKFELWGLL